jgi:hypothetical protein
MAKTETGSGVITCFPNTLTSKQILCLLKHVALG